MFLLLFKFTGQVAESFGQSQIVASSITVISFGNNPPAVAITIPNVIKLSPVTFVSDLEAFEGMLVAFAYSLQITEQFDLNQVGKIEIVQQVQTYQFNRLNKTIGSGFVTHIEEITAYQIMYDDAR